MKTLHPRQFSRALPLVRNAEIRTHLACVYALLERRQAGRIFADENRDPTVLLICPDSGFWFAFGDPVGGCFRPFLRTLLAERTVDKCAVFATSAAWRRTLNRLFPRTTSRIGFEYRPAPGTAGSLVPHATQAPSHLPDGFTLGPITEEAVRNWPAGLDPWVVGIWGGPRRFVASSLGFGVGFEGRIVSFAAACAIGGGEADIEVGTVPGLRCRGLATAACQAFIEHCAACGLRPTWSCSVGNQPSEAPARKLGFVERERIDGYSLVRPVTGP